MLNKLQEFCRHRAPVLLEEKMPVWLTILASVTAAVIAYFVSPYFNRQFQIDDARSAHIASTTQGLNHEIIELSGKIRRLNNAIASKSAAAEDLREDCFDLITQLQWRLIDLRVILVTDEDRASIDKLSNAIEAVRAVLDAQMTPQTENELLVAMRTLGERTEDVLDRLYVKASLK